MNELLNLLLYILIGGVIIYAVQLVLGLIAIPAQIKTLALVIVGLIVIVWILRQLGVLAL